MHVSLNVTRVRFITVWISFLCYPVARYFGATDVFYMAVGLLMTLWILLVTLTGRINREAAMAILPLFALGILFACSAVWSIAPARTIYQAIGSLAFVWLTYLIAGSVRQIPTRLWISLSATLSATIAALFILTASQYGSVRIIDQEMRESIGTFSNVGGAILLLTIPFLIYGARFRGQTGVVAKIGAFAAILGIALSASRAAVGLGLALVIISTVLLSPTPLRLLLRLGGLGLFLGVAAILAMQFTDLEAMLARMAERFSGSVIFGSSSAVGDEIDLQRMQMFEQAIAIIGNHPWLGIGYEAFAVWHEQVYGYLLPSHNLLITGFAEVGILGLLGVVWLILSGTVGIIRALRLSRDGKADRGFIIAVAVAFVAAVAHSMVRPQLTNPMFYLVLGIALGLRVGLSREERASSGLGITHEVPRGLFTPRAEVGEAEVASPEGRETKQALDLP